MSRHKMRNCDECRFGEMRDLELRCAHNHKPPFVVPDWEQIQSGEWGWMRRCGDFEAAPKRDAPAKNKAEYPQLVALP